MSVRRLSDLCLPLSHTLSLSTRALSQHLRSHTHARTIGTLTLPKREPSGGPWKLEKIFKKKKKENKSWIRVRSQGLECTITQRLQNLAEFPNPTQISESSSGLIA